MDSGTAEAILRLQINDLKDLSQELEAEKTSSKSQKGEDDVATSIRLQIDELEGSLTHLKDSRVAALAVSNDAGDIEKEIMRRFGNLDLSSGSDGGL